MMGIFSSIQPVSGSINGRCHTGSAAANDDKVGFFRSIRYRILIDG